MRGCVPGAARRPPAYRVFMGSETENRGSVDAEHARPEGATDAEVEAAGTVSEALEKIERARGHLYSFHQLIGAADFALGDGADASQEEALVR